ncbi:MAG: sulfatase-like hydrolase/transferase [Planctomycetota bacterium]
MHPAQSLRWAGSRLLLLVAELTVLCCSRSVPPNLILVGIDTVRADRIGALGNNWIKTPHLDALAGEAIVFERASSTAPWTLPSFASIFTGLLPSEHGTTGGAYLRLSDKHTTLAELLRDKGYATRAFVAVDWLTEDFGLDRGFDELDAFLEGLPAGRAEQYEQQVLDFIKFQWPQRSACELYDRQQDPCEEWDIARQRPDVARALNLLLEKRYAPLDALEQAGARMDLEGDVAERLLDLGYAK